MLNSYKDLIVWQKSFELAKEIFQLTGQFPRSELYGLTDQIKRAAVSIPSNIAEGFARRSRKEYSQFIAIAFGSGAELETQILLAKDLKLVNEEKFEKSLRLLDEIMRMLNVLIRRLKE
ncbi:MAG: four helix bundle protein [Candidatus Pacebacteria bacterium]|nr:four helix bundle protein [Candidatus Paceibacterota bacterium]